MASPFYSITAPASAHSLIGTSMDFKLMTSSNLVEN